jgi:hypothetical protein
MAGCRRRGVHLLEHARGECQRRPHQHAPAWFVGFGDALIVLAQDGRNRAEDDPHPAAAVPQIRHLRQAVEVFLGLRRDEAQPGALALAAERFGSDERHVVAARLQRPSDADKGVDVAGGSNRCEDEVGWRHLGQQHYPPLVHLAAPLFAAGCSRLSVRAPSSPTSRSLRRRVLQRGGSEAWGRIWRPDWKNPA